MDISTFEHIREMTLLETAKAWREPDDRLTKFQFMEAFNQALNDAILRKTTVDYAFEKIYQLFQENPTTSQKHFPEWPHEKENLYRKVKSWIEDYRKLNDDLKKGQAQEEDSPVETSLLEIEGPNGRSMTFSGLGKRVMDSGGNLDALDKEYYNARASGDPEDLQKVIEKVVNLAGNPQIAGQKIKDLEKVYQQGARYQKKLTPEELAKQEAFET